MMDKDMMIDDIIAMLDSSVKQGVGHMNVTVNDEGGINIEKTVENMTNGDCGTGNVACRIPNLMDGVEK